MNNDNSKLDKIAGTIKESAGKIIGSEQLELEGKLQKKKGEISEAVSELGEDFKEKASKEANDFIDKLENLDKINEKKK